MAPISLLNLPIWLQCVIFMILSIAFMFVLRKLYVTKIKPKNKLKDNLEDKIINETAVVTKTIDNSKNEGQVIVSGMYWQAISSDGSIINVGDNVSIDKIENMKLFVTKNQIERR
jgi:membrane protein implicated in regulation of membrane protease activity